MEDIRNYISKGNSEKALAILIDNLQDSFLLNKAVIIQARLNDLKARKIDGVLSNKEETLIKNQINKSIIDLAEINSEERNLKATVASLKKSNKSKNRLLILTIIVLGGYVVLSYFLYTKSNELLSIEINRQRYIEELESKAELTNLELTSLKEDIPQLISLANNYNYLHNKNLEAIRNGNFSLSNDLTNKIRKLPSEYNIGGLKEQVKINLEELKSNSKSIIQDNISKTAEIELLERQLISLTRIETDINNELEVKIGEKETLLKRIIRGFSRK
jgi:hypothetical protein